MVEENIEQGSTIITDGWTGYSSLANSEKYKHEIKVISGSGKEAHELLLHVHLVDSLLHLGLIENYQHIEASYFTD